jgi:hypothetical protein
MQGVIAFKGEITVPRWPIDDVRLDELDLDLRNVRIPFEGRDEAAIAAYLVESADLLGLAGDILRDGYLDNELPVVARENDRWVVMEGNRRIAALKAIRHPSLLGKSAARLGRLMQRYPDAEIPAQIRVMVSPSREAAQPMLARLHTSNPKRAWIREQQAVFYHAQLSTMTVDELRARYPTEARYIPRFLRMGEMRKVIRGMRYDDKDLEDFVKSSRLSMSSLEYAYSKPKIQEALGLVFSKDGLLSSTHVSEGQRRALMYLLGLFRDGRLDTRSPELIASNGQHEVFAEELRRLVDGSAADSTSSGPGESGAPGGDGASRQPGGAKTEAGNGGGPGGQPGAGDQADADHGTTGNSAGSGGADSTQPGTRGPNRGETLTRLATDGFTYRGTSDGMRRRFEELRRLDVQQFPNAAYDLLRTVLECAIKDYYASKGQRLPPGKTLGYCIEQLARDFQGSQRMTSHINAINRRGRMTASQFSPTETSLNANNHEPDSFVTAREVHEGWGRIKPVLVEIVGT